MSNQMHFTAVLNSLLAIEGISQADLVYRINYPRPGGKAPRFSRGTISSYTKGKFPKAEYAKLIVESISPVAERQAELAIAYLRDVADMLGLSEDRVTIGNPADVELHSFIGKLPDRVRTQILLIAKASTEIDEMRIIVEQIALLYENHLSGEKGGHLKMMVAESPGEYGKEKKP